MFDEIFVTRLHAHASAAPASLHAVGGNRRALHVTGVAYGDSHLLISNQVFKLDLGGFVFDHGAPRVAVHLLNFFEFLHDHAAKLFLGGENGFILGNVLAREIQFLGDFIDGELGQAVQLQFENRVRLRGSERLLGIVLGRPASGVDVDFLATEVGDQVVASLATVCARANDDDDVVEMIERGQVAFENVLALFGLGQQVGGAATDYVHAVINKMFDGLDQTQLLGLSVDHGEQDHAEALLHLRVLEKLVEHELRLAATLQLDHDAHAVAVALVANVRDVFDVLIVDQFGDTL